jgi:CheY-like chemotaxis protein
LPEPSRSLRVLIVDDNTDGANSLAAMLQALGNQVRVEYDGPAGVRAASAWQPEVALLDIGLPGMSGYEVARTLRANESTRDTVLIAVTGWGQLEDRRRSREAGFDRHLVKPADPLELRALLASVTARPPVASGALAPAVAPGD